MNAKKILIVDDEEKNIKLIKGILASGHYQIYEALNGEEALKQVADNDPDLILLDIMMPGMDGFEVCKRLKEDESTQMIPIVMVTALNEKEHSIKAMKVGADDEYVGRVVDGQEEAYRKIMKHAGVLDEDE